MKPGWLLPTKPPKLTGAVRDHIVMGDALKTGKSAKVFYKGQMFKSKAALACRIRVTRKVIDRMIFEGKVKPL